MNTKKTATVFLTAVIVSLGAATTAETPGANLKSLNWLLGKWTGAGKKGVVGEHWTAKDSLTLDGIAFKVTASDTIITERAQLLQTDSGLFFVADVPHNKSKVFFKLTVADSAGFLFENPSHDFPTKVCYEPIGVDSLFAWIEGPMNGSTKRIGYGYRKVK